MSSIVKKEINGHEYMFVNTSRGNRSGFVHETELFKDGIYRIGTNKCQYYNRTWECYTYQSVMKGLVYDLMREVKEAWEHNWKNEHEVKRLTATKKELMEKEFVENTPEKYVEFKQLYETL